MLFNDNTTTNSTTANIVQMPTDKTRRKRLKVVSACSECRRKKTKCNGEKPCAGCIKTNMDCKYSNTPKSKSNINSSNNNRPITSISTCTTNTDTSLSTQRIAEENNNNSSNTIHAIESRLGVIEDILKLLLSSSNNNNNTESVRNSAFQQQQQQQQQQRNMHAHSAGPYYGDKMHSTQYDNGYYRSLKKRRYSMNEQDDALQQSSEETYNQHIRLPPPLNYQPTLSESSSTSTTSSISSSHSSPKINTIQTLLNNDKDEFNNKYYSRPSAFFRPTATPPVVRPY